MEELGTRLQRPSNPLLRLDRREELLLDHDFNVRFYLDCDERGPIDRKVHDFDLISRRLYKEYYDFLARGAREGSAAVIAHHEDRIKRSQHLQQAVEDAAQDQVDILWTLMGGNGAAETVRLLPEQ